MREEDDGRPRTQKITPEMLAQLKTGLDKGPSAALKPGSKDLPPPDQGGQFGYQPVFPGFFPGGEWQNGQPPMMPFFMPFPPPFHQGDPNSNMPNPNNSQWLPPYPYPQPPQNYTPSQYSKPSPPKQQPSSQAPNPYSYSHPLGPPSQQSPSPQKSKYPAPAQHAAPYSPSQYRSPQGSDRDHGYTRQQVSAHSYQYGSYRSQPDWSQLKGEAKYTPKPVYRQEQKRNCQPKYYREADSTRFRYTKASDAQPQPQPQPHRNRYTYTRNIDRQFEQYSSKPDLKYSGMSRIRGLDAETRCKHCGVPSALNQCSRCKSQLRSRVSVGNTNHLTADGANWPSSGALNPRDYTPRSPYLKARRESPENRMHSVASGIYDLPKNYQYNENKSPSRYNHHSIDRGYPKY